MNLQLIDYFIYICASVLLTIWVGDTLFRNGRPFLVSVFKEDGLADSVNRLLVVGFYLVNFGAAAILINTGGAPSNLADMLKDRKSTRPNSSHANLSYAVFCLKTT